MADISSTVNPTNQAVEQNATTGVPTPEILEEEIELEELDEELIIEDFTIDGICGVY